MIPKFKVLNKQTNEFIPSEDIIIQRGKLYLNYRDFEDDIHLPSENYEVIFEESEKLNITKYVGMNKQEAIKELENLKTIGNDARAACYNEGINAGITIIKQLGEPQKPVIQQFVADLADWTVRSNWAPSDVIREFQTNTPDTVNLPETLELEKLGEYFAKAYCRYDFERACIFGYEVEKEPLYEVIIGDLYLIKKFNNRNDFCFDTSRSLCTWEKSAYQLTEVEIKAIDEKFWLFAVPVEEVVEG